MGSVEASRGCWDAGSMPGRAQWVKDLAWLQLQLWLQLQPRNSICLGEAKKEKKVKRGDPSGTPSFTGKFFQTLSFNCFN